jgi:nicotinamide-nucleotide amidase
MARAARDRARTDWGVAVAGVAGPEGGTEDRPVGTCFVGVARAAPWESGDSGATARRHELDCPTRTDCREAFARRALADLLEAV